MIETEGCSGHSYACGNAAKISPRRAKVNAANRVRLLHAGGVRTEVLPPTGPEIHGTLSAWRVKAAVRRKQHSALVCGG